MIKPLTHDELVERAAKWLKSTIGCRVVLSEFVAYTDTGETPDAIGWKMIYSVLVECKANRSDFRADSRKRARADHMPSLGNWRFYVANPGIIGPDELHEGWGLYVVKGNQIVHECGRKYSNAQVVPFSSHRKSEVSMLVSALARPDHRGIHRETAQLKLWAS